MADVITCPVCGKINLPGQEFCQFCQSRLKPLEGALEGADAPIRPGQAPTKKTTAELEPVLPQWLRDARDSARKSTEIEPVQEKKPAPEPASAPSFDLLSGLQSQAEDEDELPDWLTSITGSAAPKPKKDLGESSEVRWVELGGAKDFAAEETSAESDTPAWLKNAEPSVSSAAEQDDLSNWFHDASAGSSLTPQQPDPTFPVMDNSQSTPSAAPEETPDWLRQMVADSEAQNASAAAVTDSGNSSLPADTPDWLRNFGTEDVKDTVNSDNAAAASFGEEPDWLRALGGSQGASAQSTGPAAFAETGQGAFDAAAGSSTDLPDWMQSLPPVEEEKPKQGTVPRWLQEEKSEAAGPDVPSWLSGTPAAAEPELPSMEEESSFGDIPGWLKAAAPQSSIYSDPAEERSSEASANDDTGWFATSSTNEVSQPLSTPAFAKDESAEVVPPPFTPEAQDSFSMDALFTDMPDWLSSATDNAATSLPQAAAGADSITPGELPSWVQAMRPVDSGDPLGSPSGDQTFESRGALAGLQGVLPAVAAFAATNKPKSYSLKLQANEDQQSQAAVLEQILAAETAPVPIASFSSLQTSPVLRWVITLLFFLILTPVLFIGTQIFSMPVGVPPEIDGATQTVQSLPEGAQVLVALDYEPARAGEMEAAAAPLFSMLKNPGLTFISTNETGGILAQRFISGPLGGIQVINLGYLPGGQMGIRAFAQAPRETAPFDVTFTPAWTTSQLQNIGSLSEFAGLIIITDNANSARAWIEQTSSVRGTTPVVVVASAQAAPMIQPYYDSRQISGVVSGLYGGAVLEQAGDTRRYWDAYSIGMLLAAIMIVGGGLFNTWLGLRDRAAAREAK